MRGDNTAGSFDIDLVLVDEVTESVAAAFEDAVSYWKAILANSELADVHVGTDFQLGCAGITTTERVKTVDDLVIVASVREIDGPGRVLARAAVCAVREESWLPVVGAMSYDAADLERLGAGDDLEEVILHEIGPFAGNRGRSGPHSVFWSIRLCRTTRELTHTSPASTPSRPSTTQEGKDYIGGSKVPVENLAGPGSGDSHWREAVLGHELMTPYQHIGIVDPLSAITIQSLADLGYTVDATLAESFGLSAALAADVTDPSRRIAYGDDILKGPIVVVDRNGRVVRTIRP